MEKTETKLVVQTYFMGRWRDEQDFSLEERTKAEEYMKEVLKVGTRGARIIERSERVIMQSK
jgi:hypothetical protein